MQVQTFALLLRVKKQSYFCHFAKAVVQPLRFYSYPPTTITTTTSTSSTTATTLEWSCITLRIDSNFGFGAEQQHSTELTPHSLPIEMLEEKGK